MRSAEGRVQMDRDCRTCVHSNFNGEDNGCRMWNCEYINKKEALEAWKKLHSEEGDSNGREENNI